MMMHTQHPEKVCSKIDCRLKSLSLTKAGVMHKAGYIDIDIVVFKQQIKQINLITYVW